METLEIWEITDEYEEKRAKYNYDIFLKKYKKNFGLYSGTIFNENDEIYQLLFLIKVKCNDGDIQMIKFGYKDHYDYTHSPDIIGGRIQDFEIYDAIYRFCRIYGKQLFNGVDIFEIVKYDKMNILNYKKAVKKRILKGNN